MNVLWVRPSQVLPDFCPSMVHQHIYSHRVQHELHLLECCFPCVTSPFWSPANCPCPSRCWHKIIPSNTWFHESRPWSVGFTPNFCPHKDTCLLWCAWLNLLPIFAPEVVGGLVSNKHHPWKLHNMSSTASLICWNPWIWRGEGPCLFNPKLSNKECHHYENLCHKHFNPFMLPRWASCSFYYIQHEWWKEDQIMTGMATW